ncbi:uncharacterized protein CLUP02_01299 [Colletotrichum lupini]|uniref:Uncharacterized protein n=1 Tax=Colletotrichum lupini TaxID=145971 RepID=A0A9Q8W8J5_9PEZI|nr:uncharacterized protein CLUP02_01299 [Colletotrichum lupini]UQC74648.1 hypothetical protein CLUP02_01299 [Colletotrichum lupini]
MGNDPRKTWTSIVPRWRGDRWNRLTRQTIDESNRSWFVGPAGNRIVENAIRHPSHFLRAVSVFWSLVSERSLVVVVGSSSKPLRLPQASPCNNSTTGASSTAVPPHAHALSEGPELSPALRISAPTRYLTAVTAAVDSTTFGSGASPSSHPSHRIRPPCPAQQTATKGLGLPSLLRSWDASGASIPSGMQPPVSRDTCIADLRDAQSGLGHTPNVNVTPQMQIPDLSTVTIFISDSTTDTSTAHLPALALSRSVLITHCIYNTWSLRFDNRLGGGASLDHLLQCNLNDRSLCSWSWLSNASNPRHHYHLGLGLGFGGEFTHDASPPPLSTNRSDGGANSAENLP